MSPLYPTQPAIVTPLRRERTRFVEPLPGAVADSHHPPRYSTRAGSLRARGLVVRPRAGRPRNRSVARPDAGQLLEAVGAAAVDGRLHEREDRALEGGGREHLAPAVLALLRVGRVLLAGDQLPDLLEDRAADQAAQDAEDDSERLVEQLHLDRLLSSRTINSSTTMPAAAGILGFSLAWPAASFSFCWACACLSFN